MGNAAKAIEASTKRAAKTVRERHQAFLANPTDPESNHKLRVSIRTLRSLVDFLKPWTKRDQNKQVQGDLKRVVRETSRLRELDVLCELVASLAESPGEAENYSLVLPENVSLDELLKRCEREAAAERASVVKALKGKKMTKLLKRGTSGSKNLQWKRDVKKAGLDAEEVRAHFDELAAQLQADLESLENVSSDTMTNQEYEFIHDVRKRAKQVRYVSEQYAEVLGPDAADIAKSMKAEQDRLGAICDARVNRELLAGFLQND